MLICFETAVRVLNICVVTLSSLGLISTFVLVYGLAKVITWSTGGGPFFFQNRSFWFVFPQERRQFLMPWIVIVTCTTAVDFIYAVYLLIHVVCHHIDDDMSPHQISQFPFVDTGFAKPHIGYRFHQRFRPSHRQCKFSLHFSLILASIIETEWQKERKKWSDLNNNPFWRLSTGLLHLVRYLPVPGIEEGSSLGPRGKLSSSWPRMTSSQSCVKWQMSFGLSRSLAWQLRKICSIPTNLHWKRLNWAKSSDRINDVANNS